MSNSNLKQKYNLLKEKSGSHSPSIYTVLKEIPEISIKIDACFLSNPYATDLYFSHLQDQLISPNHIRKYLEFYPPQNSSIASLLEDRLGVGLNNIFIGNGAIEIIQAIIQKFVTKKIVIILPTFSSYYEYVNNDVEVVFYYLRKENQFQLDIEEYIDFVKKVNPDSIVLINPNNPTGTLISKSNLLYLFNELSFINSIILDESFIHFVETDYLLINELDNRRFILDYPNVILLKSLSKDFGIAGIRLGYSIMSENRVKALLSNGYLWNVSGLAFNFIELYTNKFFFDKYIPIREKYNVVNSKFYDELRNVPNVRVYPSSANFYLVELNNLSSNETMINMLLEDGVYVRNCNDKIGLEGDFLRISTRKVEENSTIINSLNKAVNKIF